MVVQWSVKREKSENFSVFEIGTNSQVRIYKICNAKRIMCDAKNRDYLYTLHVRCYTPCPATFQSE